MNNEKILKIGSIIVEIVGPAILAGVGGFIGWKMNNINNDKMTDTTNKMIEELVEKRVNAYFANKS